MTLKDEVNGYLKQLGTELGVEARALDDGNECMICASLEGETLEISVFVEEQAGVVALASAVGRLPGGPEGEELLAGLMAANALGAGSAGLTFSWMPEERTILLGYTLLAPEPEYLAFKSAFSRVASVGLQWKRQLSKRAATRLQS